MNNTLKASLWMLLTLLFTANATAGFFTQGKNNYTATRYPIVLAHGMSGFDQIGPINYWYGIPRALEKSGAEVYVTHVSAYNTTEIRGEQLLKQVEEILAVTGAEKVNLIGHSHGGQSVRYVAAMIPSRVASVTNVGSPAKGSPVANLVQDLTAIPALGPALQPAIVALVNALGGGINFLAGDSLPQNALGGMEALTLEGAADFNARFPAGIPTTACGEGEYKVDGIYYFSWSGTSNGQITNVLDIVSYTLAPLHLAFDEKNDGLVGRCSSHVGKVLRDNYYMDHLDEVNQIFGLTSAFASNPVTVFRQHANRLKRLGL